MNRLTVVLATILLLGSTSPSYAQTGSDILLDIPPIIAAATACEGVGEWQGTQVLINAQDYSRTYGAYKTTKNGNPSVRFNDGPSKTTRVEYDICVPEDGRYNFLVHTYASDHFNNGMFLGVNGVLQKALPGHPVAGYGAIYLRKHMWSWQPEWLGPNNFHRSPVEIMLKKGKGGETQTLSINKRKVERPYIHQIRLIKVD